MRGHQRSRPSSRAMSACSSRIIRRVEVRISFSATLSASPGESLVVPRVIEDRQSVINANCEEAVCAEIIDEAEERSTIGREALIRSEEHTSELQSLRQ